MSSNLKDLVDGEAEVDDEEDDESFDENVRRPRRKEGKPVDDSSEEEEDDDDEEEARKIREGFIVEDEDEDEEDDASETEDRPVAKKKRKHRDRDEDERLDEDDLDLIGEQMGDWSNRRSGNEPELKRFKRRHEDRRPEKRNLDDIFSDEEEDDDQRAYGRNNYRAQADEFEGFIEEDYPDDEEEVQRQQEDIEVSRTQGKIIGGVVDTSGLDKEALEDMEAIFSNSEDYDWALQMEEEEADREREVQSIELKDVFEPSQLVERMLTDEDNEIRFNDEPERFQLERRPFKNLQLTAEQFKEEARWIAQLMLPKKNLPYDLVQPFTKAVGKVMEFFFVDDVEVPYIFHHRKDYLIHQKQRPRDRDGGPPEPADADKLLTQEELWRILELDIKFRSLIEKRNALEKVYDNLKRTMDVKDKILDDMISQAITMEELQDLQDYLNFEYAAEMKDLAAMAGVVQTKRPGSKVSPFERVRKGKAYQFVRAYGVTADQLSKNVLREGQKITPDDDPKYPDELADSLTGEGLLTGEAVMMAARSMYAEELFHSPRMRRHFRIAYYQMGQISCHRTEKGLRKIDEEHPFYDIKYIVNQTMNDIARNPELFLKMTKAEEEGLVEVRLTFEDEAQFRRNLNQEFESENVSDRAEQWRLERRRVLDMAFDRLSKYITKGVKENLRMACQDEVLKACREEYFQRLDQRPYRPRALEPGETPRVLAVSNGMGDPGRDPIFWVWVEEYGRVLDSGSFVNLARDEAQREAFAELVKRLKPDVIGVSGWSAHTARLARDLENAIGEKGLTGAIPLDDDRHSDDIRADMLKVVVVDDEVARLYKDSPRANVEHPSLNPVLRYCIALARYMQNPLREYAALGKDITSVVFHPCQNLLPQDKLMKYLETAMVDMVNLCGVNINEAVTDTYVGNLLPYVAGLGPRKATSVIKVISANGGVVNSRDELVGDPDSGKMPVVGPRVWNNLASFLYILYDPTNPASDPLDNTRVHPEDYELGRKMAADALELDEEDVKAETDENGAGAIVRKLFKQQEQEKVNELVLEEYAEQLEKNYNQRKRATLENIRGELQTPYEDLRKSFIALSPQKIFTLFTGETPSTLCRDMIIPVNVRLVKEDFAIVKLDCGIEGRIEAHEVSYRSSIKEKLQVGQTVQAKVLEVSHKDFVAKLTVKDDELRRPYRRPVSYSGSTWNYDLERRDKEDLKEKDKTTGRTQRVVNHPLFKPFNATQAEEYLGSQPTGELIIRPSSKGNDHLAVTWKVAEGVFQHLDVLELQKENEFSVGRTLRVGGKYTYSDLDELIVEHVKAMAKKVDELMQHEKFQNKPRSELDKWLTTFVAANNNRSAYAFCVQPKHPGYFSVVFSANKSTPVNAWPIKVVPHAYEMAGNQYPDMRALCNGFKLRYQSELNKLQQKRR